MYAKRRIAWMLLLLFLIPSFLFLQGNSNYMFIGADPWRQASPLQLPPVTPSYHFKIMAVAAFITGIAIKGTVGTLQEIELVQAII